MKNIPRNRFQTWHPRNDEDYSPLHRNSAEGDGERKVVKEVYELTGQRVALQSARDKFPDVVLDGVPFAEVKSFSSRSVRNFRMGNHPEFSDEIRKLLYESSPYVRVPFDVAKKMIAGYLGKSLLSGNFGTKTWEAYQKKFVSRYIQKAGGLLFLVSQEGYIAVDDPALIEVYAIDRLEVRAKSALLPFPPNDES